jgi:hypothetical protein
VQASIILHYYFFIAASIFALFGTHILAIWPGFFKILVLAVFWRLVDKFTGPAL